MCPDYYDNDPAYCQDIRLTHTASAAELTHWLHLTSCIVVTRVTQ